MPVLECFDSWLLPVSPNCRLDDLCHMQTSMTLLTWCQLVSAFIAAGITVKVIWLLVILHYFKELL